MNKIKYLHNFLSKNKKSLMISLLISPALLAQTWQSIGPGPLSSGQVEGIVDRPVIGAIHGIAAHPTDADIIYVATVNGGIWKTVNATAASPNWVSQTDDKISLSMGDIEFDRTDETWQTLVAGSGRFSSFRRRGGDRAGVFRTTDGGETWVDIKGGMDSRNIASVEARGTTLLAAVDRADSFACDTVGIFRSTNTGASWSQLSATEGIPRGGASSLVADPLDNNVFYAGVNNLNTFNGVCSSLNSGIYKTTDAGASWNKVSDAAMEAVIGTNNCHFEIAVGRNVGTNPGETGNVFVSMVCQGGELSALFRSGDAGNRWTAMDIPITTDNEGVVGLHPGRQGKLHSSIAADPTDDNIVYIGGDRQPFGFPNSIGANDYSGRLFRGDASQPRGSQMTPLTHMGTASNSAPHADSRDMTFDSSGNLLESDDGGIYKRLLPRSTMGDWVSINGNLAITEQHDAAYDSNSKIVVSGNQDNGTSVQNQQASSAWTNFFNADGGDVVVDTISLTATNESVRYYSFQNLGAFRRVVYDQNNIIESISGPALTVINGGNEFDPQFVTPLAINNVNGNRMILGGDNSVYESIDQGDTIIEIAPGLIVEGSGRNNIAYGASDNADILYVGACQGFCVAGSNDGVFVRTETSEPLSLVYAATSSNMQGVAVNPTNSKEAFAIDSSTVIHTTDTGTSWTDVTGNLSDFGTLRSIALVSDTNNKFLVVGTNKGVFKSEQSEGYSDWTTLAPGLPNVPVFELQYDALSDSLIAGTLGRGSFVLNAIKGENSPPVIGVESITVAKGGSATTVDGGASSLIVNDSDPDMDDMLSMQTIAVTEPLNGLIVLNEDGSFNYQHDNSFTDSDQFIYRVCDNRSPELCSDGQVDIAIDLAGAVCSSPNLNIPDNDVVTGLEDTLTMTSSGMILDLDVFLEINHTKVSDLIVTLTHVSSGIDVILLNRPGIPATVDGCTQNDVSVTLDDSAVLPSEDACDSPIALTGNLFPTEFLSDFNGLELSGNWRLNVNDTGTGETGALISWCLSPPSITASEPPVLSNIDDSNVQELDTVSFTATALDADTAQNDLVFSLSGQPEGASITSGGEFSFTPTELQGPGVFTFDIIVSDDSMPPLTDTEVVTITVTELNQEPGLNAIGNLEIDELNLLSFTATTVDLDLPEQSLSYSLVGEPLGASINNTGNFTFVPTEAQGPGIYKFEVVVTDGEDSDSEEITVTVNEVNRAPVLNPIGDQSVVALQELSFTASATDTDLPSENLSFSLMGEPAGASITSGGEFAFTPTNDQAPNMFTFDVIVSDEGVPALTDRETITIDVSIMDVIFINGFEEVE